MASGVLKLDERDERASTEYNTQLLLQMARTYLHCWYQKNTALVADELPKFQNVPNEEPFTLQIPMRGARRVLQIGRCLWRLTGKPLGDIEEEDATPMGIDHLDDNRWSGTRGY